MGEVVPIGGDPAETRASYPWLAAHPHLHGCARRPNNTVYIATECLEIEGLRDLPGAGLFAGNGKFRTLTAPESTKRSKWRLPASLWPAEGPPRLSYHAKESRWRRSGEWVYLDTVGRGQDFVYDADGGPEAMDWIGELFA